MGEGPVRVALRLSEPINRIWVLGGAPGFCGTISVAATTVVTVKHFFF
jgi:hypothetical protein